MILSLHSQNENQRWVSHNIYCAFTFHYLSQLLNLHLNSEDFTTSQFTLQTFNEFDPDIILKYFDMISTYYVGEISYYQR